MNKEALEYLQENLGFARGFDDDEKRVYDRRVYRVPPPVIPRVSTRTVSTLSSFAGYVSADPDGLDLKNWGWIHVESPSRVALVGSPDEVRQREIPLTCECPVQDLTALIRFDDPSLMIPAVIAMHNAGDKDDLLKMLATVTKTNSEVLLDDMGSQTKKVERGAGLKGWEAQKNPLSLAPFRTFPEIEQPVGLFVVRWNADGEVQLKASPDERWRVNAAQRVRAFLLALLGDDWEARTFA
jgi:hypothetical protein